MGSGAGTSVRKREMRNNDSILKLCLLLLVVFMFLSTTVLHAQETYPGEISESSVDAVELDQDALSSEAMQIEVQTLAQKELQDQINAQKRLYLDTLQRYRVEEDSFQVLLQQHAQLQTLASLEEAVQGSQSFQLARAASLEEYFKLLLIVVQNLRGGELSEQLQLIEDLQGIILNLQDHQLNIQKITTYTEADESSVVIDAQREAIELLASRAQIFIKLSRVQAANDQVGRVSEILLEALEQSELTPAVLAQKQRGYDELSKTIQSSKQSLFTQLQRYKEIGKTQGADASTAVYTSALNPIYASMQRSLNFLKELSQQ